MMIKTMTTAAVFLDLTLVHYEGNDADNEGDEDNDDGIGGRADDDDSGSGCNDDDIRGRGRADDEMKTMTTAQ